MIKGRASGRVLCVGETMALVTPTTAERLRYASSFHLDAAGAESNVAAHLASLEHDAMWFSRLGDDELGRRVADIIGGRGVDVSSVVFDPSAPTGVYFKDPGNGVLYYRNGSAASLLSPKDVARIDLTGLDILHVSGITAALSDSAAQFLSETMGAARQNGALISFDVNFRSLLWAAQEASRPLHQLAESADLVFVGRDEAHELWGVETAGAISDLLRVPQLVVKDGAVGAIEFSEGSEIFEPAEEVEVVEIVGAGDAFAGGYLSTLLTGGDASKRLRAGHRRAALTVQTTTDFIDEIGTTL